MLISKLSAPKIFYGLAATFALPALALTGVGLMQQLATPSAAAQPNVTSSAGAGQWAYQDENGNLIPPPADAPAPPLPEKSTVQSEEFELADGGVGIRNPRVSYTYAVRNGDDSIAIHCENIDRAPAHACAARCEHLPATDATRE